MRCSRRNSLRHTQIKAKLCLSFLVLGDLLLQFFLDQVNLVTESSRILCAHLLGALLVKASRLSLQSQGEVLPETYLHSYRHILAIIALYGCEQHAIRLETLLDLEVHAR